MTIDGSASIERTIDALESASAQVMLAYLMSDRPDDTLSAKVKVAIPAFANVQRHRSAENARDALTVMMAREGVSRRRQLEGERSE